MKWEVKCRACRALITSYLVHPTSYFAFSSLMPDFSVIILAAGMSTRFGTGQSKLAERIGVSTVLGVSVAQFLAREDVSRIVVAAHDAAGTRAMLGDTAFSPRVAIVPGGANRAESVWAAAKTLSRDVEFVAVHDGARPGVSQALVDRVFAAARTHGAAGPALPVELTIKQATGPLPAQVTRTIPRETLWAMQTPQAMRLTDLLAAFETCPILLSQVTDDLQLLELANIPSVLVEGDEANLKITRPADLETVRRMLDVPI